MRNIDENCRLFDKFMSETHPDEINKMIEEIDQMAIAGPTLEEYFSMFPPIGEGASLIDNEYFDAWQTLLTAEVASNYSDSMVGFMQTALSPRTWHNIDCNGHQSIFISSFLSLVMGESITPEFDFKDESSGEFLYSQAA